MRMVMRHNLIFYAFVFLIGLGSSVLKGANADPRFDVASIRAIIPSEQALFSLHGGPGSNTPGRFDWEGSNLLGIITRAFGISAAQLSGPTWLGDERFVIHAKFSPNTDEKTFKLMLQQLLEDRFRMAVHHVAKPVPAYNLVIAKRGYHLKAVQPDPDAPQPSKTMFTGEHDKDGFPVLPRGATILSSLRDPIMVRVSARMTMSAFATELISLIKLSTGNKLPPVVVDRTGLKGLFEFKLEFARVVQTTDAQAGGPTIFSALERQLGLSLTSSQAGTTDTIVIDHIERTPTAN